MKKGIIVGAVLLLAIGLTGSGLCQEKGVTKDKIKVGVLTAMTGPYAEYGVMWSQGGKVVLDEVNEKGGIHGRKIEYIVEDDSCDSTKGSIAGKKLIYNENVFALYAGVCTGVVNALVPDVEAEKIPLQPIGAAGTNYVRPWNKGPSGRYIFGGAMGLYYHGESMAEFALSRGWKKVAILYQTDQWGVEVYKGAKSRLEKAGLDFVNEESIVRDATDASVQVIKMREKNADAVILALYPRVGPIVLRQAYELGLKTNFVASAGMVSNLDTLRKTARDEALQNFYYLWDRCDIPGGSGFPGCEIPDWIRKIKKANPDKANDPAFPNPYSIMGVGTATIFVEGLRRAGQEPTREKFINAMESMKDFDTKVLSSKITFTPEDHLTIRRAIFVKYNGERNEVVFRP